MPHPLILLIYNPSGFALANTHIADHTQPTNMFASLADRIACINLLERDDRYETAKARFAKVGLDHKVQFYRVDRSPHGSIYGCYDSHRRILMDAFQDPHCTRVLIFEDDVLFLEGWEQVVKDAKTFLDTVSAATKDDKNNNSNPCNKSVSWDALFLGCSFHFVDEMSTPKVWRVKCGCAHAYIVSRQGMENYFKNGGADFTPNDFSRGGHDLLYNNLWQNIYAIADNNIITQDAALGTNNFWVREVPLKYAPWLQSFVLMRYVSFMQLVLHSKYWYRIVGRRYAIAIDDNTIDDGRLVLKGLWYLDFLGCVCSLILELCMRRPPYGYWSLLYDSIITLRQIVMSRLFGNSLFGKPRSSSK